ncbi:MAG: aminomethyl-transferring glycine dehydrogenase subunit GcvPB [Magnetococcales bacterium]|nr:aminomethyl-transferring glycine dehydrogenase subunit GcvPB [Magnetococcales bacterium]
MSGDRVIFEESVPGRSNSQHAPTPTGACDLPQDFLRAVPPPLPEVSELEVVRHYTQLSQKNFSVDTQFYPLGSCTMKYNPRVCNSLAMLPGFLSRHPLEPVETGQGLLATLYELQEMLAEVSGMAGVSLTPMAGAQGEFAGIEMIRAYHHNNGDVDRVEMLVPDAAHGTNPATAALCGFRVREIATDENGDLDLASLKEAVGPQTAGLMLTNPSTLGVFERRVEEVIAIVHEVGGLLYYDGANLNAITGRTRPGDMGFDAIHINVHKTFSTPHGGGGPGAGPVGVSERLKPFLPTPIVTCYDSEDIKKYRWLSGINTPHSIGQLSGFMGNIGVLLRAYVYLRMLGGQGMRRVADHATLNANYLLAKLTAAGFTVAFPNRRASHEFILTLKPEADNYSVTALDFAKRLLDYGFYAPTIYFPMLVPECMLIEPTETESKGELDRFVDAMVAIRNEAIEDPRLVKGAPHNIPLSGAGVGRLDETQAARKPDLKWNEE